MTDTALDLLGDNIRDAADFLDGIGDALDALDDEGLVILRAQLEELRRRLGGAIGAVDLRLIDLVPIGASVSAPGIGQIVVEAKGRQTTHGTRLAATLAARVADSPANEDGEALPPSELCARTAAELVDVFALDIASATFRAGAVKARGLKPGAFREFADGQPKVRFMAAGEAL